jgi:hypothetical protein
MTGYSKPKQGRLIDSWVYSVTVKVKVKFSPEEAMKAQRGSKGIVLLFNLGAREECVVNVTPGPLYSGNEIRYPLNRKLGGPHGRSGRHGKSPFHQ